MTFYSSVVLLTELMMAAMTLHVMHYAGFTKTQKRWYLATFAAVMLCAGAEFLVHSGVYDPSFAVPLTVVTVLQFSVAPLLGVLFSGALGMRDQRRVLISYFLINLLIETVSAPFGWIFSFNADGYCRGRFFFVYEAFYLISLVYLIVNMILAGKKFRHRDDVTICMILAVLLAGILPMTVYKLNITYVAIAISASLCYIYYNDLVQQDNKAKLIANQEKISGMQSHILSSLANLIENRDFETGTHVSRTGSFVEKLTNYAMKDGVYRDKLNKGFVSKIKLLAPLHDVGKIVVPDRILKKPGPLTDEEFEQMKQHTTAGGRIVRDVLDGIADEDSVSFACDIATYHHERWDGTGYPDGLSGEVIPLSARIMAIADVFDALISERCYKKAYSFEESVKILESEAGTHFDPHLIGVFLRHKEEFEDNETGGTAPSAKKQQQQ